jgi:hypothetical protein
VIAVSEILTVLINYGLAGVVIYLFYTLISQKLHNLEAHIKELTAEISKLREEIARLRQQLEVSS